MQERWLSVEEIAAHLGVNPDTIYKWSTRKKMPAHKLGRLWRFLACELDRWVKAGHAADDITANVPGTPARQKSGKKLNSVVMSEETIHEGRPARLRKEFLSGEATLRSVGF